MKPALLILTVVGLIIAGLTTGLVQDTLCADQTNLVWVVIAVALIGTLAAYFSHTWLEWLCDHGVCLMLGLLGTVVGFMAALMGLEAASDVQKLAGVHTALSTTAVGMVAHLYLILLERVSRR